MSSAIVSLTPSQTFVRDFARAFGEEATADMYDPPLTPEQTAALARARGPEKSYKLPSDEHVAKQNAALARNTARQERLKAEIAQAEEELAKKVPGTLRELKKTLKELKQELREVKVCRGCLYNGGVW